jgi:hypothetical protein
LGVLYLIEGQGGLGKPRRRLRLEGNQPQQGTADEANGNKEAGPLPTLSASSSSETPFFLENDTGNQFSTRKQGQTQPSSPSFDEWWKKTGTHRLSICLTNGGIKLAESRQESGHGQHLTHRRPY